MGLQVPSRSPLPSEMQLIGDPQMRLVAHFSLSPPLTFPNLRQDNGHRGSFARCQRRYALGFLTVGKKVKTLGLQLDDSP